SLGTSQLLLRFTSSLYIIYDLQIICDRYSWSIVLDATHTCRCTSASSATLLSFPLLTDPESRQM
ncbi:hypothetical protein QUA54_28490, partial [Microcoleus sp. MOSTC5]|uniref:hypothetical protein n=1 Tax=Microcoleus sp. MOSTC5 TaxID=3055378 RepID=UPI002FD13F9D